MAAPTRLASTRSFALDDDYDNDYAQDKSSPSSYDDFESSGTDTYAMSDDELEASSGEWDEGVAKFNTIHVTGRIGNDPEPRYLDDGKVVVNLSLATKRKYHSLERQAENVPWGQEETDWYALEIWGTTAEFVSKFVDRGTHVSIIGSLQIDEWTDKATGELRNKAKIIVRDFDILESKEEAEARRSRSGRNGGGPNSAGSGDFF
jgi:single-strand DNA-binding protein